MLRLFSPLAQGCRYMFRGVAAVLLPLIAFAPSTVWAGDNPRVLLKTTKGDIVLELEPGKAPATVENFLGYVRDGFYDGTVFHRVINGFMIQGGGLNADLEPKETKAPVENEADNGLLNEAYTVAMARTMDPHSATAQFFINVKDNDFLNHSSKSMQGWGYCVFGRIVEGEEVLEKIRAVPTTSRAGHQDVPVDTVIIESVTVDEDD